MADVLLICIREECKHDFIIELITKLMSRGLTISYAGAYYNERKDEYIHDDDLDIPFFGKISFEEAQMKSKNFRTWEGFLDNIDFEQIDAKLVICAIMCTRKIDIESMRDDFRDSLSLEIFFSNVIVELIKNSFEMTFFDFKSHYPEFFDILDFDEKFLDVLKNRVRSGVVGTRIEWESDAFDRFLRRLLQRERELREGTAGEETLQKLEHHQRDVELECLRDPSKGEQLALDFFGSNVIEEALKLVERFEIVFYFHILKKISQENILCLYYEEEIGGEGANLYFYSKSYIEKEMERNIEKENDIARWGFISPYRLSNIPRTRLKLHQRRQLYALETIKYIVDDYVMLALHPPLVDVYFPANDFMLELDPEEPEIGFLSRKINLGSHQILEESLRVGTRLRKKLHIYKLKKDSKRELFHLVGIGDRKDSQEENIFILGRVEDLFRIFIVDKRYGRTYQLVHAILKPLAFFAIIFLALSILQTYPLEFPKAVSMIVFRVAIVLPSVILAFWALRASILNYLLEPMYKTMKWFFYTFLAVILSLNIESLSDMSIFFLFLIPIVFIIPFNRYICSAILHNLNNSFRIIDYRDILEIESSSNQNCIENAEVLKCRRFQTILKKDSDIRIFLNSKLFPKIKFIKKRMRFAPRKMAYSSGFFFSSEDVEEMSDKDNHGDELLYRKPNLFGKGEIVSKDSEDIFSPKHRYIYFGHWNYVMNHIRSAAYVFSRSVLSKIFRSTIILIVFLGLLFNGYRTHMFGFSLINPAEWIENITFLETIFYLITPIVWILLTRKLKVRFWKAFLALIFYLLLGFQPPSIRVLAPSVSVIVLFLLLFPLKQALYSFLYSFRIWVNEKIRGDIISVINRESNLRGTIIEKNLLVTRLLMRDYNGFAEERIYFNERFFKDIIMSYEWKTVRGIA